MSASLRNERIRKVKAQAVPETPPQAESQSNVCTENKVKLLKGALRFHALALEGEVAGRIPTRRPVTTWLVPQVADCITKYLQGNDGKTLYQRFFGTPVRDGIFALGEQHYFRTHKAALKYVNPHWLVAARLSRRLATFTHSVWDGEKVLGV